MAKLNLELNEKPVNEMDIEELKQEAMSLNFIYCDIIKEFFERQDAVLKELKNMTGPGFEFVGDVPRDDKAGIHWQDDDGLVWCTEKRTGTFVEFRDFGVTRTRDKSRDESKGLSMTKARNFGYKVEGK